MISRIDRYIAHRIFFGTGLVLAVLAAMTLLFSMVDALGDLGRGNYQVLDMLRYVLLTQARKLYELFPIATLIGSILGLSLLALNSELIALRAAGVSVLQILISAIKAALVLAVLAVAVGEFVVPAAESAAVVGRARAMQVSLQKKASGLWLRDGKAFVNIGEVLPDGTLLRLVIYELNEGSTLTRLTRAERARYDGSGLWRLFAVRESTNDEKNAVVRCQKEKLWNSQLTPETVNVFTVRAETLPVWQLVRYIEHLRQNNQETAVFRLAFWQKITLPFAIVAMILAAAPFVFRHFRGGGMGQRLFTGVLLGLAFVVLNKSFGFFGLIYGLPPALGATLPILPFLVLSVYLLRRAG
jgi:lipopolysaccharide export system permease protein